MNILEGDNVRRYRLHVMRQAIKVGNARLEAQQRHECHGTERAGGLMFLERGFIRVKREFGFKGVRSRILEQLEQKIAGEAVKQ
jgi:hypothetical protein